MIATATLTSKGKITIPASVRAALGLDTGSRVEFVGTGKGKFAIVPATSPVVALKGVLGKPSKPVSIEDMHRVFARKGRANDDRILAVRYFAQDHKAQSAQATALMESSYR